MKKMLWAGASCLALTLSTAAFAQNNSSTITQTGSDDDADVTQTGATNVSEIEQDGAAVSVDGIANEATVLQEGVAGFSRVVQTGDNIADVTQTGTSDTMQSVVTQSNLGGGDSNTATVIQRGVGLGEGSATGSFVTQTGTRGVAFVDQGVFTTDAVSTISQSGNTSGSQRAEVFQISGAADSSITQQDDAMKAEVYQDGSSTSTILQTGRFHTTGVRQEGDGNFSSVVQTGFNGEVGDPANPDGSPLGTDDASIGVFQLGEDNRSEITQSGDNQFSDVRQFADDNFSRISQGVQNGGSAVINQFSDDNHSEVDQTGSSSVIVTQTGAPNPFGDRGWDGLANSADAGVQYDNNVSLITQSGDGAEIQVGQNGQINRSNVIQSASDSLANDASVIVGQTGVFNTSFVDQSGDGSQTNITQGGGHARNLSSVVQSATDSTIDVIQTGENLAAPANSPTNESFATQSGTLQGATIIQDGDEHLSNLTQSGEGNNALVTQLGVENTSTVTQSNLNNFADVDQFANSSNSHSTVTQSGEGSRAFVEQGGDNQTATITQDVPTTPVAGIDAFAGALVRQEGANNTGTIDQSGDAGDFRFGSAGNPGLFPPNHSQLAEIDQNGVGNTGTITQTGLTNAARAIQDGDRNRATYTQSGRNTAGRSVTTGDDNVITVEQSGVYTGISDANITQLGNANTVTVTQDGGGLRVAFGSPLSLINQEGNTNTSTTTQSGNDEAAFVDQIGDRNRSTITQNAGGNRNVAVVDQNAFDGISTITQSGDDNFARLMQGGTFNESVITQDGSLNSAVVTQGGMMDYSGVMQTGTSNIATVNQNVP